MSNSEIVYFDDLFSSDPNGDLKLHLPEIFVDEEKRILKINNVVKYFEHKQFDKQCILQIFSTPRREYREFPYTIALYRVKYKTEKEVIVEFIKNQPEILLKFFAPRG